MNSTEFHSNQFLMDLLTDYVEDRMSEAEKSGFEAFLDKNNAEREFARKVAGGRALLRKLGTQIHSSEDFEAKLALRISLDKEKNAVC